MRHTRLRAVRLMLAAATLLSALLFALSQGLDTAGILPLLGLFAFAGYRMLPAFQNIFNALALLRVAPPERNAAATGLFVLQQRRARVRDSDDRW